mgnify:FL=1
MSTVVKIIRAFKKGRILVSYEIVINDPKQIMDERLDIYIKGFEGFEKVTIILETKYFYNINAPMNYSETTYWKSEVIYLSDASGVVSVNTSTAIGGDYLGVRDMGLFETLRPMEVVKQKRVIDLNRVHLKEKVTYQITALLANRIIAQKSFDRWYKKESIQYMDIIKNAWQGRLFFEEPTSPRPAIIVLSGSDGGIEKAQNIAMLLSNYGFVTMAISYFGMCKQPSNLNQIPIESIEEALQYLKRLEFVDASNIGIYGRSKGAELALLSLTKYSGLKCAVLNSPSDRVYEGIRGKMNAKHSSWTYEDKEVPYKPFRWIEVIKNKLFKIPMKDKTGIMELEKVKCPLLLISSFRDEVWNSFDAAMNILTKVNSLNKKLVLTTELGHMNTISYLPNIRYNNRSDKIYGEAVVSWESTVSWFIEHLMKELKTENVI